MREVQIQMLTDAAKGLLHRLCFTLQPLGMRTLQIRQQLSVERIALSGDFG